MPRMTDEYVILICYMKHDNVLSLEVLVMKFRKKPVVIEAYQTDKTMYIETLEGIHRANPGDWIITGVKGEQYPCKPDIFEKTYEPVFED